MPKPIASIVLAAISLERQSDTPLHRQLYDSLRRAILAGQLRAGTRLPSTRTLAQELGLSRNTVLAAFDQLLAEGYVEGTVGSGTFVAAALPDDLLTVSRPMPVLAQSAPGQRRLSQRGTLLAATTVGAVGAGLRPAPTPAPTLAPTPAPTPAPTSVPTPASRAFRPGLPALDAFPFNLWRTLANKWWRQPPAELLGYGEPAGYRGLREAIAGYLGAARAVRCAPEQVVIVSGSQQGLDLAARLLLDPGDPVWMEEPGYRGARGAFQGAGARVIPVPVGQEGLDIPAGIEMEARARLAYVTPSHQFPLGVTMTLPRRLELLRWASQAGAWIIEDDYDSEYRYVGQPLAALQGLDQEGRVIYLGTFSKVLFPSLRLGYLVVPPDLVEAFAAARALSDRHSPSVEQAILADFIIEGHFARHIRRMRTLYAERQALLLDAAGQELAGLLELEPAGAGMHLLGWLPPGADDQRLAQRAALHGVDAPALSGYALHGLARSGLLLGYAATNEAEIRAGVQRLAAALRP
ncbi:MAG: PLP-dependent aminotransferase family protein [Ardenticatenales bacterium]|nr:PLP-dependent aminotransferase family protein [Ardenticatenales bacterium]